MQHSPKIFHINITSLGHAQATRGYQWTAHSLDVALKDYMVRWRYESHMGRCRAGTTLADRFWSKVAKGAPDECWLWIGAEHGRGYGGIAIEGKSTPAHRVAWLLTHGEVPYSMWVLHRCDVPKCVNPAHLFLGTHQDNMDDMVAKGRSTNGRLLPV